MNRRNEGGRGGCWRPKSEDGVGREGAGRVLGEPQRSDRGGGGGSIILHDRGND